MCTMHSVARKQHPCLGNTQRRFRQLLVIAWAKGGEGGGGSALCPEAHLTS